MLEDLNLTELKLRDSIAEAAQELAKLNDRIEQTKAIAEFAQDEYFIIKQGTKILPQLYRGLTSVMDGVYKISSVINLNFKVKYDPILKERAGNLVLIARGRGKAHSYTLTIIPLQEKPLAEHQLTPKQQEFISQFHNVDTSLKATELQSIKLDRKLEKEKELQFTAFKKKHKIAINYDFGSFGCDLGHMPLEDDGPDITTIEGLQYYLDKIEAGEV